MIELKNVSKFYSDNNIVTIGLKNIDLKLNKGEFVAITGDSGSGKSTLLNVISLIDTYDEGEVYYYGNETFYFNQNDSDTFRKNNVSFIFQKYNIIDSYTVLQNVMLPLLIKGKTEEDAKKEALQIIEKVGLKHRANNKGTKLSGGEKQRCVIARALATDAPILACDEPTGNLDKKTSQEIIELIKEVSKDKLVLVVTHDYDSIKDICTRKIKLSDGEIVEDITFNEGIDEENKELVLKDMKPSYKMLFNLAFLNIFSTPKKTIFSTLVFTFVSCVLLLLSLFMVQVSYEENYTYNDSYRILSEERMIIYADHHESLDMSKLKEVLTGYEYYENAFYEETQTYFNIGNNFSSYGGLTFSDVEYELVAGESDVEDDEFIVVMPSYYYSDNYDDAIGDTISILVDYEFPVRIGTLAGVGISDDVGSVFFVGKDYNQNLANIMINNAVSWKYKGSDPYHNMVQRRYDKDAENTYLLVPNSLKDEIEFNFNLNDLYNVSYDLEIVYTDEESVPTLVINDDYLNGKIAPDLGGVKEITVYANNIRGLSNKVEKLGYDVSIPSMIENDKGANLIVLYLLTIVIVVTLIILFFISFAIIQRIYLTKTKDYSIFRTLGLVSKDIKKILNIEVITTTLFSLISGTALAYLIIIASETDLYRYTSLLLIVLYVFAMLMFGLLTSNRLNSKIFKNTVYQGIREGSE